MTHAFNARRCARLLVLPCVLSVAVGSCSPLCADDGLELFESRIRPVLVERCYHCHNSAENAEGGLALDFRDGLLQGGDGGRVVVPGHPERSRLLPILRHEVEGLEMPADSGRLSDSEIADFERWIRLGAVDPRDKPLTAADLARATSWETKLQLRKQWWSFQPLRRGKIPQVAAGEWSGHPVDRFLFSAMQQAGLEPSPRAEAAVLVRRAFFVVLGLPPTPEELDRWEPLLKSQPEDGMASLADHLLQRPEFGERWARHWMDWIRYAESHGSEGDPRIDNAWHYRDYLIRALNADVPYDQLVREHVAGDLLAKPRVNEQLGINESAIGPAHWRMVFHGFAPTDALEEKVRFTDDQINTFSKAFLGLTVSCARCHDHKFDAISQRDYYALFGVLGSTRPARTVIDLPQSVNRHRAAFQELKPRLRQVLADDWIQVATAIPARLMADDAAAAAVDDPERLLHIWFRLRKQLGDGKTGFGAVWQQLVQEQQQRRSADLNYDGRPPGRRWQLSEPDDYAAWFPKGAGLPAEPHPAGTFAIEGEGEAVLTGIYPAGVYSHGVSSHHPARLTSPAVPLDGEYDLWVRSLGDHGAAQRYVVQNYPRNGTVFPVTQLKPRWRWQRYSLKYWDGDEIHVELTCGKDAPLLVNNAPRSWFGVTEAVLVRAGETGPVVDRREWLDPVFDHAAEAGVSSLSELADCFGQALQKAIADWRRGDASDAQALLLDHAMREGLLPNSLSGVSPKTRELVAEYRRLENQIPEPTRVPGLDETVGRNQRLFQRGDHRRPGEEVPRRFLEAIDASPYEASDSGRRQLAEDVLRPDNPLTRRVIVNRVWHHVFGRGIVATPDNFGRLGQLPDHPQLLDDLAVRFSGEMQWSMKRLVRFLLLSRAWQGSSTPGKHALRLDPQNRLLSHMRVRRLEAESIRDAMLAVSGQLDRRQFGPPVNGGAPRRSIYVAVIRNSLDPFLRAFDFPEPFSCTGRRDATNVPAQSLMLLNDPAVAGHAVAWADRVVRAAATPTERVEFMFRTALGRSPDAEEVQLVEAWLDAARTDSEHRLQQRAVLQEREKETSRRLADMLDPVREKLRSAAKKDSPPRNQIVPVPRHEWNFAGNFEDSIGAVHGTPRGGATVDANGAIVRNGGYVVTQPLPESYREKTLEAWVRLDNLQQRGGGVMTIQTPDGRVFDSIVFGEQSPRRWLAGSNNFARTQPFADASDEREADQRPVHIAIAWHADGTIAAYRDGRPWGRPYRSRGLQEFHAGQTVISFGVRHLPAGGNRLLSGRIVKARVYDRALSAAEVAATAKSAAFFVTDEAVLAELSQQQREVVSELRQQLQNVQAELTAMGDLPDPRDDRALWADVARAIFTFKEFIYVR